MIIFDVHALYLTNMPFYYTARGGQCSKSQDYTSWIIPRQLYNISPLDSILD